MDPKSYNAVASELYTAEASESRLQAQADVAVPDPTPEEARQALEEAQSQ